MVYLLKTPPLSQTLVNSHMPTKCMMTEYLESCNLSFPLILMKVLDDESLDHIIRWLPDGNGFQILDKKKFSLEILPNHFNTVATYRSFTRRMNRWRFILIAQGPKSANYFHPMFQRGDIELARLITPILQKQWRKSKKKKPDAATAPHPTKTNVSKPTQIQSSDSLIRNEFTSNIAHISEINPVPKDTQDMVLLSKESSCSRPSSHSNIFDQDSSYLVPRPPIFSYHSSTPYMSVPGPSPYYVVPPPTDYVSVPQWQYGHTIVVHHHYPYDVQSFHPNVRMYPNQNHYHM